MQTQFVHPWRSCARKHTAPATFAFALFLPLVILASPPLEFRVPPSFPVGNGPWQIVAGHFNGDALPDVATANFNDSTVSILLGADGGGFSPATHIPVGSGPGSLATGDFNQDGIADIVTANANGWSVAGTLTVLLGNGNGTFALKTNLTVGRGPRGVVVADFNNDGNADLATAISGGWFETNKVEVVYGKGDGTFNAPVSFTVGTAPSWIAAADFNHDNLPDLVVVNAGPGSSGTTASVLLNTVEGPFALAMTIPAGTYPGHVAVADFDRDTHPDFAVANRASGNVSLHRGRGDGTFLAASYVSVPAGVGQLAIGDFNADNNPDLAVLGGNYDSGAVTVLPGTGSGTFGALVAFNIGAALQALAAGDFNTDTKPDLLVAGGYDNTVLLMPGNGDGTFKSATDTYATGTGIHGISTGDFNKDGQLDIITANLDANSVSVIIQQTNGAFSPSLPYPVGSQPYAVKVGDFNNDGWQDLITANWDGTLTLLRGRTTAPGVFTNNWAALSIGSNHTDVALGFFNSGANLDVVTPNYYGASLSVALGVGNGTFHTPLPPAIPVNGGPTCVVVDDFDGDGESDIAVGYEGGMKISVIRGKGDGTFNPKTDIDTWEIPWFIRASDVNGDGKPDIVAAHYDWRRISVMINRSAAGGIQFDPPLTHEVANDPVSVGVGDFNGDNLPDIVSGNFASVSVLLGNGDGTFLSATNYFVGGHYVATGDFNQDAMPDLAINLGGKVGLFWNDTLPRLQISKAAGGVRVAYPAWKPYSLEVNTNLSQSSGWTLVTVPPAKNGNQFVITNNASAGVQSYRLKRPAP